jgi:hypothetical protein
MIGAMRSIMSFGIMAVCMIIQNATLSMMTISRPLLYMLTLSIMTVHILIKCKAQYNDTKQNDIQCSFTFLIWVIVYELH